MLMAGRSAPKISMVRQALLMKKVLEATTKSLVMKTRRILSKDA